MANAGGALDWIESSAHSRNAGMLITITWPVSRAAPNAAAQAPTPTAGRTRLSARVGPQPFPDRPCRSNRDRAGPGMPNTSHEII